MTRQTFDSDVDFCESWFLVSGSINGVGTVVASVSGFFQCFLLPIFRSLIDSGLFKSAIWVATDCASQKSHGYRKKMPALHETEKRDVGFLKFVPRKTTTYPVWVAKKGPAVGCFTRIGSMISKSMMWFCRKFLAPTKNQHFRRLDKGKN